MNVTADATVARRPRHASRWDDEGVEARPVPIVRDGVLRGFLSSRETAAEIGLDRSGGCMRAEGFARQPIVRMTNVNLEPGDAGTLDDLIADTDDGLLMETNRSWSIDQRRLQLPVRHRGRLGDPRTASAAGCCATRATPGVTPEFWARLDAVCSRARVAAVRRC